MNKQHLLIVIVFFFITACSHDTKVDNIKTIQINCDNEVEEIDFSDFVEDEMKFVFLESGNDKMIGEISSIRIIGDTIYILDLISQSIFRYGMDGNFISKLSARGHAHNEYTELVKYGFDVKDTNLYVHDKYHNRILIYDKDNKYIKTITLEKDNVGLMFGDNIIVNNDKTIDIFGANAKLSKYHFVSLNSNDEIDSYQLPIFKFEMSSTWNVAIEDNITRSEENILLNMIAVDTIYQVKDSKVSPLFAIDFGAKKLTDAQRTNDKNMFFNNDFGIYKVALGGKYILIHFRMNKSSIHTAVCSKTGDLIGVCKKLTYRGAIPFIERNGAITTDDYLIDIEKPFYSKGTIKLFKENMDKYKDKESVKKALDKLRTIDETNSNPTLIIMKWKK